MIKKSLLILVAVIGFGISASSQTAYVTGQPSMSVSRDGTTVTYTLTVRGEANQRDAYMTVKVCPTTRTMLDALYINCESVTFKLENPSTASGNKWTGTGEVTFSCSVKTNETAPRCGAYDFKVDVVNVR